jgi:hypothetical protein
MSKYYAIITGGTRKNNPTSRGHNGITTFAASYQGAIKTEITHDRETGRDKFVCTLIDWPSKGKRHVVAEGYLDTPAKKPRKSRVAKESAMDTARFVTEFDASKIG